MPRRVRGNVAASKHHLQKKTPGEALWQKANVPPVDDANATVVAEPWVMRSVYEAHLQDEILSPAEQSGQERPWSWTVQFARPWSWTVEFIVAMRWNVAGPSHQLACAHSTPAARRSEQWSTWVSWRCEEAEP